MRKIELLVLKRDVDEVMQYLGLAGCLQLITEAHEQAESTPDERQTAELKAKVEAVARFLDVPLRPGAAPAARPRSRDALREGTAALVSEAAGLIDEENRLVQQRLSLRRTLDELSAFSSLPVPLADLSNLSYLTARMGTVAPEKLEGLAKTLENRAVLIALDTPGSILAVSTRRGRFALDSELSRHDFQPVSLPQDQTGVPAEVLAAVRQDLERVDGSLAELESRKRALRQARGAVITALADELDMAVVIDSVKQGFAGTGSVQKVTGWIPRRKFPEVSAALERITQGRMALKSFEPEELPDVRSGKTKVPVAVHHGRIVRSFERMVFSYSVPLYGTVDPTPFVAAIFVPLFAIMFGDVGQGAVGLILGLLINSGWVKSFESYRKKGFGNIFVVVGIASMISGFLYGSFFANEEILVPLSRAVSGFLLGRPLDHIISLSGFQKILLFFGITVGIGAVINSIGLVINLINRMRSRNWHDGLLSKTGLAGALFFWYALFVAVRVLLGRGLHGFDLPALAVPLLALFFREPLIRLVEHEKPVLKDGLFAFIMEGIVEVLESAIYYVSNSVSFLRVAAFALAHTVLSSIVFLLADMVGGAAGGIIFRILVIFIGNAIIIVLEGLIVTIQVVRLEYYEFFSKFFTESGEEFKPFTLRSTGGSR